MAAKKSRNKQPVATLRPVGVSDEGNAVLLARRANSKGTFRLPIDDALVAQLDVARARVMTRTAQEAARAAEAEPAEAEPKPPPVTPKLTIKEIQVLLRQGKAVAAVARRAGVDPEWVERFEPPIIWERAGMAQRARRATLYRARMGPSGADLGESVELNLKGRRVPMTPKQFAEAWDSLKRARGNRWVVSFRFQSRGRTRSAQWEYDPATDKLRALDALAGELGWIPSRRRRR